VNTSGTIQSTRPFGAILVALFIGSAVFAATALVVSVIVTDSNHAADRLRAMVAAAHDQAVRCYSDGFDAGHITANLIKPPPQPPECAPDQEPYP
jgi:hypothetical protein